MILPEQFLPQEIMEIIALGTVRMKESSVVVMNVIICYAVWVVVSHWNAHNVKTTIVHTLPNVLIIPRRAINDCPSPAFTVVEAVTVRPNNITPVFIPPPYCISRIPLV